MYGYLMVGASVGIFVAVTLDRRCGYKVHSRASIYRVHIVVQVKIVKYNSKRALFYISFICIYLVLQVGWSNIVSLIVVCSLLCFVRTV